MEDLLKACYIPLDKSWIIRMGVLDLLNGYNDCLNFLKKQKFLSDDLKALYKSIIAWNNNEIIPVGESGTLYRFLRLASWKLDLEKQFILSGTLKQRKIYDDPTIIFLSLKELLKLDGRTSQWASASVLLGNPELVNDPPFKLKLTYEAVDHWKTMRENGLCWEPRYDKTILIQAEIFIKLLKGETVNFTPKQAEDYCFARAFNFITKNEGEKRWPQLHNHESDRLIEMEKVMQSVEEGEIDSKDHRVVQAIAMLAKLKGKSIKFKYLKAVSKSWPQFWDFLKQL